MAANTDPAQNLDPPLAHSPGRIEGAGRVSLRTLHSAKGREFDLVIMYGVNASDIPSARQAHSCQSSRGKEPILCRCNTAEKHLSLIYCE
ncbi:hypothetical protein TSA1_08545 [Bradyrhizobium nitroreducens]|uniref:UvrD-like helicase C-terminal domain-containing protein n=1 Tax=Bradyrhizobium nitroreducens TaxID=709803 RepID=A0A2M6U868_9BRAD|nr:3'-5' exonuclease [Bradyrhizobium nitroreducens]PIT00810.1 hypothetical protein TSA1_08545 [Bradyrhizobium nitroreducens]